MLPILVKAWEVAKIMLPFLKTAKSPESLASYAPSKTLLINLPLMFSTWLLDPMTQADLNMIFPGALLLVKLFGVANVVNRFYDNWRKLSSLT